jgi:hypothetical protein
MKYLFLIFLSITSINLFAQTDSSFQIKDTVYHFPSNGIYMLETVRQIRNPKVFPMDEKDCYMQIENQYAFVSFRYRGKNVIFSGSMINPILVDYNGVLVQVFTVVADDNYNLGGKGNRYFLGVPVDYQTNSEIYFLNRTKAPELFMASHLATAEEIEALKVRTKE